MIGRIEAQRNVANEFNGVTMVHEFKGQNLCCSDRSLSETHLGSLPLKRRLNLGCVSSMLGVRLRGWSWKQ